MPGNAKAMASNTDDAVYGWNIYRAEVANTVNENCGNEDEVVDMIMRRFSGAIQPIVMSEDNYDLLTNDVRNAYRTRSTAHVVFSRSWRIG